MVLMLSPKETKLRFRWMLDKDRDRVLEIEREVFRYPYSSEEFDDLLATGRLRGATALVAELDSIVVGYFIYHTVSETIEIISIAIDNDNKRRGIGSQFINRMIEAKRGIDIRYFEVRCAEVNLDSQLFFSAMGFKAVAVLPNFYGDDMSAYLFEYKIEYQE